MAAPDRRRGVHVCFVLSEPELVYWIMVEQGARERATELEVAFSLVCAPRRVDEDALARVVPRGVDALIAGIYPADLYAVQAAGHIGQVPLVEFGDHRPGESCSVGVDEVAGGEAAALHLVELVGGQGQLLHVGLPGLPNRRAGFSSAIARFADVEIIFVQASGMARGWEDKRRAGSRRVSYLHRGLC